MVWRRLLLAVSLAALPVAGQAAALDYDYLVHALAAHHARLLSIGWRLAKANAPYCRRTQSAIGLALGDVQTFEHPDAARKVLGIGGDISVEAVARGSPAEAAGLRSGDEVQVIAGESMAASAGGSAPDRGRLERLHDRIDAILAQRRAIELTVASHGQPARKVAIPGEAVCGSRFDLLPTGEDANADGAVVRVAVKLFAEYPIDDQAAAMVGHELSHNILGHRMRINRMGRNYLNIRRNEREADRLAPWLMVNAGYDPAAAPQFITLWGKAHDRGITRGPTHDGYQARAAEMSEEVAAIAAARAANPALPIDWRGRFRDQGPD